jgi:hypothetical protein
VAGAPEEEDVLSSPDRVSLSELFPHATVTPLGEGEAVENAFLLLQCADSEGERTWSYRTTSQFNLEELLGALTVQVELVRQELLQAWAE